MADKVTVKAVVREARGSNDARRLRNQGKIPVSVYGGGEDTIAAIAEISQLAAILRSDSGVNTIFSIDIDGVGVNDVIFHDRQIDPLKGKLMHADLRRIAKGEKLELTVPIHLVGEPADMEEGGVLTQNLREVKVLCIPSKIPDFIEVDVSELTTDKPLHVSDLKVEDGVEIHEDDETIVASIVIVKEEELEPSTEEVEPELVSDDEGGADGETESTEE